jgi:hypothetical protein
MKYMIRPLTKRMIAKLRECRQMEIDENRGQLCPPEHFNSSLSGLYARGLVNLKRYTLNGKELMGVYLTQSGINLLANIEESHQ